MQLQGELNLALRDHGGSDDAGGAGAVGDVGVGLTEDGVIERVEELRAKFEICSFREEEQFSDGDVAGDSPRPVKNILSRISECVAVGNWKCIDVEPEIGCSFAGREIAVGDAVGTEQAV